MTRTTATATALILVLVAAAAGCERPTPPPRTDIGSVAVIVLDDFTPQPAKRPTTGTQNCAYHETPANEVGSTGGGGGLPRGITHGRAVYDVVKAQLDAQGALTSHSPSAVDHPGIAPGFQAAWTYGAADVLLIGVDVDGYSTTEVADRIDTLLPILREDHHITRVVLNMSFIIAPCDVRDWLDTNGRPLNGPAMFAVYRHLTDRLPELAPLRATLDNALAGSPTEELSDRVWTDPALAPVTEQVAVDQFYRLMQGSTAQSLSSGQNLASLVFRQIVRDPLNILLTRLAESQRVVPVGAAGNGLVGTGNGITARIQFDFPFAPALWNSVTSASASRADVRAPYSNSGEVMLDGTSSHGAQGTSFAAPRLAALQALYLLRGGAVSCERNLPPLGYVDVGHLSPERPRWADLTAGDAAAHYCGDFTTRIDLGGR